MLPGQYSHSQTHCCSWGLCGWYKGHANASNSTLPISAWTTFSRPSWTHVCASSCTSSDSHWCRPQWWSSRCCASHPSKHCRGKWCFCWSSFLATSLQSKAYPAWQGHHWSSSASLGSKPPLFPLLDQMPYTLFSQHQILIVHCICHIFLLDQLQQMVLSLCQMHQT